MPYDPCFTGERFGPGIRLPINLPQVDVTPPLVAQTTQTANGIVCSDERIETVYMTGT